MFQIIVMGVHLGMSCDDDGISKTCSRYKMWGCIGIELGLLINYLNFYKIISRLLHIAVILGTLGMCCGSTVSLPDTFGMVT